MRFRSAVLAVALLSVALPAFARGGSSEARKWKELLPRVRATSDCLAHGLVASAPVLENERARHEPLPGSRDWRKPTGPRARPRAELARSHQDRARGLHPARTHVDRRT